MTRSINKGQRCEKGKMGERRMRAKAQAKHVSRSTENKAVRKRKAGKAKSEEDFCAEEAHVKVPRAQRWVKSQNVKFRQGNNYRQRQKDYFANRDMEKE